MPIRLGILSDTHGHLANTEEAVRRLNDAGAELVIHCGDIGSIELLPLFAAWPTHFVFGNVDRDREALREAIQAAGQTCHGTFGHLVLERRRIGFLHGDDSRGFRQAVDSQQWDLLCYGHTHQADWRRVDGTRVLNPGAVFRACPPSVAVLDLPDFRLRTLEF